MNRLRRNVLSFTAVLSMLAMPTVALTSTASAATTTSKQVVVSATQPWTDTGIDVSGSDDVALQASGSINVGGPQPIESPAGGINCTASTSQFSGQWVALGFPCWSLIARVGDNPPIAIGGLNVLKDLPSGRLFLGVDDETAAFGDNSGSWSVTVYVDSVTPLNLDSFNQWLSGCIQGQLNEIDPGCEEAAWGLAGVGHSPEDVAACVIKHPKTFYMCLPAEMFNAWLWSVSHTAQPGGGGGGGGGGAG